MKNLAHIITRFPLMDMRFAYLNRAFCPFAIAVSRRICHAMRISDSNHMKWQIYSVQSMLAIESRHRVKGEKQCLLN